MNTEFKKAFNSVEPDAYMESRIWENIKDKKKRRFPLKAVISFVLAVAVTASCAGGIYYKTSYTNRPFSVMVAYAEDGEDNYVELESGSVYLPQFSVNANTNWVNVNNENGFSVYAENIKSVQYKSENGSFIYADQYRIIKEQINRTYYSAVIPVSDNDADEINIFVKNYTAQAALEDYMERHDVSAYFSGSVDDVNGYQVDFMKCEDVIGYNTEPGYAFFLFDLDKVNDYYLVSGELSPDGADSVTVNVCDVPQEVIEKSSYSDLIFNLKLGEVGYYPTAVTETLLDDPDADKSKLPSDKITITVTFNDGKKARKTIYISYDSSGAAQFVMK